MVSGEAGEVELVARVLGGPLEVSAALVQRFGGLHGLLRQAPEDLATVRGVGPARAARLHAALLLGRRAAFPPPEPSRPVISASAAFAWLGPPLRGLPVEELHALYLDRRRRPLSRRVLTRGCDRFTVVDPRQIFRPALSLAAAGVVIGHNHPSGDPTPSPQDREVTRRVAAAGRVIGVELVDHLVICDDRWVSLRERGDFPSESALASWTG